MARRSGLGFAGALVSIDSNGYVNRVSVSNAPPGLVNIVLNVAKLTTWYPAKVGQNQSTEFSGKILFKFDGSTKIRYFPDWLEISH